MYLIRDAVIADVYRLAKTLRDADRAEIVAGGLDPTRCLRDDFYNAVWRRTAEIDGDIAAMWGITGSLIGDTARAFLMTAPVIETLPLAFAREARREAKSMLRHHRRIEGCVHCDYFAAQRFLQLIGFAIGAEVEFPAGRFRHFAMERA